MHAKDLLFHSFLSHEFFDHTGEKGWKRGPSMG
jgi:hypothetical protein